MGGVLHAGTLILVLAIIAGAAIYLVVALARLR